MTGTATRHPDASSSSMPGKEDHLASTITKHASVALKHRDSAEEAADPFNTDEWDPNRGAFWQHAVAGSLAGLTEHSLMFPIDTIKTHVQVSGISPGSATITELLASCGVPRLWRGVQTMFAGCIPAHAVYFSTYETCMPTFKALLNDNPIALAIDRLTGTKEGSTAEAVGAGAAVSVATVGHDVIMTPMDVMKQRIQLGYHQNSVLDCFAAVLREQGPRAFVVSLPLTLCMNLPYAAVMGTSNELIRNKFDEQSALVYMGAGACSGALAAAATAPLDAIKTRLQTQHISTLRGPCAIPKLEHGKEAAAAAASSSAVSRTPLAYANALAAARSLYTEGGVRAFYRGVQARMLVHAPSVGICWTTYETAKRTLERIYGSDAQHQQHQQHQQQVAAAKPLVSEPATEAPVERQKLNSMHHMVAGSIAGVAEHAAVFPIDTIKTHVQAASAEEIAANGTLGTARNIVRQYGAAHLLRGLSALLPAIGPAHALMFSGYERVLQLGGANEAGASTERVAFVGAVAGVVSTVLHDSCMVPAETIKQRLQLGYYRDAIHCFQAMLATGGSSFFRSLPTTLAMNIPYGSLMIAANESLKKWMGCGSGSGQFDLKVFLLSGGISGALAAGLTTPLDVIKTKLQVQSLSAPVDGVGAAPGEAFVVRYSGFIEAMRSIHIEEGAAGFFRGIGPRMAMFGPSCAISWVACKPRSDSNPALTPSSLPVANPVFQLSCATDETCKKMIGKVPGV